MKRSILFALMLSLLAIAGCTKKVVKNEEERPEDKRFYCDYCEGYRQLKGKVEHIAITKWNVKDYYGSIIKENIEIETFNYRFNEQGQVLENPEWIEPEGCIEIVGKNIYKYDSNGKIIERTCYDEYRGAISEKDIYTYDANGNLTEKASYGSDGLLSERESFDSNGNTIETLWFDYDGSLTRRTYSYDTNGNLIKESDNKGFCRTYKYDTNGNEIECDWHESNGERSLTCTQYDWRGNKTEEIHYKGDGIIYSKYLYKYDWRGNMIEEIYENKNSANYNHKYVYKYDWLGNKTEEIHYEGEGELSSKHLYTYSAKGNLMKEEVYDSNGILTEKKEYNANGDETECTKYNDDGSISCLSWTQKYNDKGLLIEYNHCNGGNISDRYKYDEKDNLIEVLSYCDGAPAYLTEYNITYYE